MTRHTETLGEPYFDELYAGDPDPWRFETSGYEAEKYAATIAALPPRRFVSAFEIGCSIGVLTAMLAPRCDRLLAVDLAAAALERARRRCAGQTQIHFARMGVPADWPTGTFDLILLSEMVYYLAPPDIAALAGRVTASLSPGGTALLVHWTGETHYPVSGDEAVRLFAAAAGRALTAATHRRETSYRLDLFHRA